MKASAVAELLLLDAGLNRYASAGNQSAEKAVAWAAVIEFGAPGLGFEEARRFVIEHYAATDAPLTPYALVAAWEARHRRSAAQIAHDVRSARARGLIPVSHSERDPLPAPIAARLAEVREREHEQAAQLSERAAARALAVTA